MTKRSDYGLILGYLAGRTSGARSQYYLDLAIKLSLGGELSKEEKGTLELKTYQKILEERCNRVK